MKGILLVVIALSLVGCGKSPTPPEARVVAPAVPNVGSSIVIATIAGGDRVVTYNESLNVVCIENAIGGSPSKYQWAAFSCWETNSAPKKMQELIVQYLNGKK